MYRNNNDSKKIAIAAVSLCGVVFALAVFTVIVYNGKRSVSDNADDPLAMRGNGTETDYVSQSDISDSDNNNVSPADIAATDVSSAEPETNKNVDILNPDYKSDYYLVVYIGSQTVVAYQKEDSGEYTKLANALQCSTGAKDTSPTAEGVYVIEKKEKWTKLKDNHFGHYNCLMTSSDNSCHISSLSYSQKSAWMMLDKVYENLGTPVTAGDIQLCIRDAYWIYTNVPEGTQVNVVNKNGPDSKLAELPKRKKINGGWDPTDKWSKGNPYFD